MPERSRTSRKMRLPWSRRRLTQPMRTTCWPALAARSSPQRWVRSRLPKKSSTTYVLLRACGPGEAPGADLVPSALANVESFGSPARSPGQELCQLRARNLGLNAGGEVLHCKDSGLKLIFAQDDDAAGRPVRRFQAFL